MLDMNDTGAMEAEKTVVMNETTGRINTLSHTSTFANREDMGQVDSTIRNERTQRKEEGTAAPLISAGNVNFVLKGKVFKAVKSISDNSGEAQIILVEREGRSYCLKVYYPNYRFKDDILKSVWNINMDMVVKLYDYGHTIVNGIERDYELMEFLEGGPLSQYNIEANEQSFRIIALQAAASLAAIHNFGIIHKDVKPGNFFFRDLEHTQLVLGDFGISSMMKDDEELLRTSQARTPVFAAPEMYDEVIDGEVEIGPKVDFYSLGITLLYLWLGKSPFAKNERLMMRMKQEGHLPHIGELPERVALVIKGLTSINPQRRWGYEEVERWFLGEDVPVDTSSVYLRYKSFMVDPERNLVAHDLKELVPLLHENPQLGVRYLYSNRLSKWLDECGNNKMAVLLNDIVEHRYPTNQQAGLMAALYAMEPHFPYYDVNGQPCNTPQEIALSLLHNSQEYMYRLRDPEDGLFVFLSSHFSLDMNRLRSYFATEDDKSVIKMAFEIDKSLPFLMTAPCDSIRELIQAYSSPERTEDEWRALSDGRLLSWLSGRADVTLCEAVKVLSAHGASDVRTRGYQILYNIDRACGFDLRNADSMNRVAMLFADKLLQCQNMDDETFAREMADFLQLGGRLEIYAQLHQWTGLVEAMHDILDVRASHNTERYGVYDLRTAAYKLCKYMGVQPAYHLEGDEYQTAVHTLDDLQNLPVKDVRLAIRNGYLVQWISVFFQEDPTRSFPDEESYNLCVKDFLQLVGSFDGSEMHYKRYTFAREQMERKFHDSRSAWDNTIKHKNSFRLVFLAVNVLWLLLLAFLGIDQTPNMINHVYSYVMLAVGLPLGVMLAVRNYFRGNGFSLGLLYVMLGILLSLVPAAILSICLREYPGATRIAALAMSVAYLCFGLKYAFGKGTVGSSTDELKGVFRLDEKEALNELLYYTFRMRTFKFKGSTFALMDNAVGEARSNSTEKVINCLMWSLIPACLILNMLWFHSSTLGHTGLDVEAWKQAFSNFWSQFFALLS